MKTIKLTSADQVSEYVANMCAVIARAMLTAHGKYGCTINGVKTLFVIIK